MFEKSRNDEVDDDASMKSSGDLSGNRVREMLAELEAEPRVKAGLQAAY